jgi:hypothetical protein
VCAVISVGTACFTTYWRSPTFAPNDVAKCIFDTCNNHRHRYWFIGFTECRLPTTADSSARRMYCYGTDLQHVVIWQCSIPWKRGSTSHEELHGANASDAMSTAFCQVLVQTIGVRHACRLRYLEGSTGAVATYSNDTKRLCAFCIRALATSVLHNWSRITPITVIRATGKRSSRVWT